MDSEKPGQTVGSRAALLLPIAGLALLSLALYWPVTGHDFLHLDDPVYVTQNRYVKAGLTAEGLGWAFNVGHASNWHPLTWLSHMLDVELFGVSSSRHHLVNLLLHTINGLLLFVLLRRLVSRGERPGLAESWGCAWVAAVFLIHPQRLESVAWIAERKDVLSGLFFMLTLLAYLSYAARRSAGRYAPLLVLFALGLMAKPMLVTVPLILILIDLWLRHDGSTERLPWSRLVMEKTPLLALALASSGFTIAAQGVDRSLSSLADASLFDRVGNGLVSYVAYLGSTVWPMRLAVHYPFPVDGLPWWRVLLAALLLGAISAAAIRLFSRAPWFLLGWLWYLLMLVPVLGLIQVGMQARADRYMYLPQLGVLFVVGFAIAVATRNLPARAALRVGLALVVLAGLGTSLRAQLPYWADDLALFERSIEVAPGSAAAHFSLAIEYSRLGRKDDAIAQDREALRLYPDHPRAHNHLGALLAARGDYAEGIEHIRRAIELQPEYARAYFSLGTAHLQSNRLREAAEAFQVAIAQNPRLDVAHTNLGYTHEKSGDAARALASYGRAVELNPDSFEGWLFLGSLHARLGHRAEAVAPLETAARLRPGDHRPLYRLGLNDLAAGDPDAARRRQIALREISPEWATRLGQAIGQATSRPR